MHQVVQIQLPIPYAYSRMRRHGLVSWSHPFATGEQRDKQVTTAASSPISGFRVFPLTPSDGESPLSMGYGESSSPQLLLLLDSFMHRQTQTNGSGVCNIFQQKDPFFFNLTLLIPFSHMPVLMNEA